MNSYSRLNYEGYLTKTAVVSLVKKGASAIITDDLLAYKDMGVPGGYYKNMIGRIRIA